VSNAGKKKLRAPRQKHWLHTHLPFEAPQRAHDLAHVVKRTNVELGQHVHGQREQLAAVHRVRLEARPAQRVSDQLTLEPRVTTRTGGAVLLQGPFSVAPCQTLNLLLLLLSISSVRPSPSASILLPSLNRPIRD
jgi:hypothetical protein